MSDKPRKRPKAVYGADGMRLLSCQTLRRRWKLDALSARQVKQNFVASFHGDKREMQEQDVEVEPRPKRSSSPNPSDCALDPRVSDENVPSLSDLETIATSLTNECDAVRAANSTCEVIGTIDEATDDYVALSSDFSDSDDVDLDINDIPSGDSSPAVADTSAQLPVDTDYGRFNAKKLKEYIQSDGDTVMFEQSNLKSWQVILVILGLCTRFSLSVKARRALIEATKLFAGPRFSSWDISDYYLSKIFNAPDGVILYHFYCQVCCKELEKPVSRDGFKKHEAICEKCSQNYKSSMNSPNYFISIDLKYQITSLLNLTVVKESLMSNLNTINPDVQSSDEIRDVYDGLLYQKLLSETPQNSKLLTCVFNTDGAPLFNSSKRSFWPILIVLNELPPQVRFRYPLLVGLCIDRKEPSPDMMNTFMKYFVKQLQILGIEGFNLRVGKETVHFILKPLACSVGSVARPIMQNRRQFNGYYGGSWCYSKGVHKHGSMRFLTEVIEPLDRTHNDYMIDVTEAAKKNIMTNGKKNSDVRGVKGESILAKLDGFDMVWAFFRDYLHADLIGVTSQLWSMLCDSHCPVHLSKSQQNEVNERLMNMTPPREVHRLVRPLKTEKCKWKASEWRSWLLFYAIPCLTGIVDDYVLQHLGLYVNSIYTLLKTSVSETDLQRVEYDLQQFVIIFEVLYGERYITFNVHSLKHLVNCVRYCGPLWATSTFLFESTIHDLKQYVHGPKGVYEQMAKKSAQSNVFRGVLVETEQSPNCLAFHNSLFGRTEVASFSRSGDAVFIGPGDPYIGRDVEFDLIDTSAIRTYRRCIRSGMVIHRVAHDRPTKTDNTMFITQGRKVVQVLNLIRYGNAAFAKVKYFVAKKVILRNVSGKFKRECPDIDDVEIGHLFKVLDHGSEGVVPLKLLTEKCVVMKVSGVTYVSRLPNNFEVQ